MAAESPSFACSVADVSVERDRRKRLPRWSFACTVTGAR